MISFIVEDTGQLELDTVAGVLEEEQAGDPLGEDRAVVVGLGDKRGGASGGYTDTDCVQVFVNKLGL